LCLEENKGKDEWTLIFPLRQSHGNDASFAETFFNKEKTEVISNKSEKVKFKVSSGITRNKLIPSKFREALPLTTA
jgi:hypothetical protein